MNQPAVDIFDEQTFLDDLCQPLCGGAQFILVDAKLFH